MTFKSALRHWISLVHLQKMMARSALRSLSEESNTEKRLERLRCKLAEICPVKDVIDCLETFLGNNNVGSDDLIIFVQFSADLSQVDAPIAPAERVRAIVDALVAHGGRNIGNRDCCFLFPSHTALHEAKQKLGDASYPGNVSWAFIHSEAVHQKVCQTLEAMEMGTLTSDVTLSLRTMPCVNTHMICYYRKGSGRLDHSTFHFFTYY